MLIVAAEVRLSDGSLDRAREALRAMEQATREEPGCLTYAFSCDVNDPTMLRIIERWESQESLQAHFKTPHMAAFGAAVADVQPQSMEVKVYEVAREIELPR